MIKLTQKSVKIQLGCLSTGFWERFSHQLQPNKRLALLVRIIGPSRTHPTNIFKATTKMLLPKFTIRQLMLIIVIFAFCSAILGWAARGSYLAYGLGIAMIGLIIPFSVYAVVYWTLVGLSNARKQKIGKRTD